MKQSLIYSKVPLILQCINCRNQMKGIFINSFSSLFSLRKSFWFLLVALFFVPKCFLGQGYIKESFNCPTDTCIINNLFQTYRSVANNNPDSAIKMVNYALKLSKLNSYLFGEINSLRLTADLYSLVAKYDSAIVYLDKASALAKRENDLKSSINILNLRGNIQLDKGDYEGAIFCYKQVLDLSNKIKYSSGIAKGYANLGVSYYLIGNYTRAIDYYNEAIPKLQLSNDSINLATITANLSAFYQLVGDFEMAIEVCKKSLTYITENDDVARASININLGRNYTELNNYVKALFYYKKALALTKKNGHVRNMVTAYNNIGTSYVSLGYFNKGIENLERGLALALKHEMESDVAHLKFFIAKAYNEHKFTRKAKVFAEESSLIADSLKIMELMVDNYLLLGDIYSNLKDYKSCNNVLLKHIEAKEAIQNDYYHNQLTEMEVKYKLDIKEKHIQLLLKDSLHKNEIVINQQNQLSWKKRETNYFVIGGFFLIIGILLTAYFLLKYRKVNKVIFAQKSKVEHQKSIIEIKNRDITDSIKYAERIQKTMLPTDDNINENLKNSFVLYKPKDIVAGDFYWLEKKEKAVLFAVADCTGHGVPGAIVSVVCNNALNRAVRQYGLSKPNQILDKAKEIVVDTFSKNEDVRDGMDVAVCSLDGKKLLYSGANNPLWLFRSGELIIYPSDRQPVGKYEYEKKFSFNEIDLIEGDTVYIFSDGYADQFGGQKNKKFKSSQLKKLLLSVQQYDMKIQKEILNKEFDKWRGNFEQMDDVCLMGVRI